MFDVSRGFHKVNTRPTWHLDDGDHRDDHQLSHDELMLTTPVVVVVVAL
jgi:hypothetical protein